MGAGQFSEFRGGWILDVKTFTLLPSAGRMKKFSKPRALLSLGKETVIERLVRQSLENKAVPLVATGSVGLWGWTEEHAKEFEKLSCKVMISPAHHEKYDLPTIHFLLQKIQEPDAKIIILAGDYVFSDGLFKEILTYPAPSFSIFSHHGAVGATLGSGDIPEFIAETGGPHFLWDIIACRGPWFQSMLGYKPRQGSPKFFSQEFVEIDVVGDYELALALINREKES